MARHNTVKRTRMTVYFDESVHRALQQKAASTETSISELVNDAIRAALDEDAEGLSAFEARKNERGWTLHSEGYEAT
jgi:hypothetical protein